jgi:RNA polymerase-binding protein DksA
MADQQPSTDDPLARKAEEIERLRDFVNETTFAGDQREVADELSVVDQHPADVADITMQREVDYTIKGIVEDEAEQIQEAMQRKAEGRYGICEDCGRPIPKERLEARPQATLCIDCQRKRETGR